MQGILHFEASSGEIAVTTHPSYHQVFFSLSCLDFSDANSIQSSYSAKLWVSFEVLQKSLLCHFSLYRQNIRFCIKGFFFSSFCSVFFHSFFFSEFKRNDQYFLLGFEIGATLILWTLMVSFVIVNDQFLSRVIVLGLKSKECLEWLREADIPPAPKIIRGTTALTSCWKQVKTGNAQWLKTSVFRKFDDLVLQDLGTEQGGQILSGPAAIQTFELKDRRIVFTFLAIVPK